MSSLRSRPSLIPVSSEDCTSLPAYTPGVSCTDNLKLFETRFQPKKSLYPKAKRELKADLESLFHRWRKDCHGISTKLEWRSESYLTFKLDRPSVPSLAVKPWNVDRFFNRPISLYWAPAAQHNGSCPLLPYGCIYKQWYRHFNNDPDIDFGHFFANPIQSTPTGPQTISDITAAHRNLCDQVSSVTGIMAQGRASNPVWRDFRGYRFLPLYRAAFIIIDNHDPADREKDGGYFVMDDEIRSQNAIIVLTGDDSGLSAPVTFESIREQSLPLELEDVDSIGCHQVIRVSLLTAVHFILDLEQREETAFPNPYIATDRFMGPHTENISFGSITASDWAEEVLQNVQERGLANVKEAQIIVRNREAREQETTPEAKRRGAMARSVEFVQFFHGSWK